MNSGLPQHLWTWLEARWRWAGRKLAWVPTYAEGIALFFGAIAAALALAHSSHFPKEEWWSDGHPLPVIQVGVFVLWLFIQLGIVIAGAKSQRNRKLEDACREVAALIDDQCPALPLRDVGVRIWIVSGPPWARYLRRGASFLLSGQRSQSGIRWVKGKGAVGVAWQRRLNTIIDIEDVRKKAMSQSHYEALPETERLGLSWDEFQRTPAYQAVFACPLYSRVATSGDLPVLGVLAVDLLRPGYFQELKKATEGPAFEGVVGLCEDALTPK